MNPEATRLLRKAATVPAMAVLLLLMGADAPESCASIEDAAARLACYDQRANAAPAEPATGEEPAAAPSGKQAWEEESFGKEAGADTMKTSIVGKFTEWGPGTPLTLANGQHWVVVEDRRYFYPKVPVNPDVVITRGFLGYTMEITALGRRVKVRRMD